MVAGISTACLYPAPTEEAFAQLAAAGVSATEVFLNSDSELAPSYLKELRTVADGSGMRVLSVHPFTSGIEPMLFFSRYTRRFEDGRDYYKRYYEAVKILGGELVVFHGNVDQIQIEQGEYFQRFSVLLEDARKLGVQLCHENVSRCSGRRPGFFREMLRELPEAKFVLDIKQARRAGEAVKDFLDAMGSSILHVHISDHTDTRDCLSVGKGTFNTENFLLELVSKSFDRGVVVELYRENFGPFVELIEGYQLLSRQLSTVSQNCQIKPRIRQS